MSFSPPTTCKSCGAPIEWCQTAKGHRVPLDLGLHEDGNIEIIYGVAYYVQTDGPARRSHFVSCPSAATHRRKRRPRGPARQAPPTLEAST